MKQPKLPVPPATEEDYLIARDEIIAAMKPEVQETVREHYRKTQEQTRWKSKTCPWKTDRQLAAEAKSAQQKR